ncbi:MAG: universal stress protein [Candidatus Obscuribacterales bacterium]|nr:universal stress protein [Candidatus Obscuribacterales bacterium]
MKILIAIDEESFVKPMGMLLKQYLGGRDAEFFILKVIEPLLVGSYMSALPSPMLEEILKQRHFECSATVRKMALCLRESLHVQNIHENVVEGFSAASAINQFAADREIDLIVVGTHHRGGLSRMLEGSVSSAIISHAPCSVLIVDRQTALRDAQDAKVAAASLNVHLNK